MSWPPAADTLDPVQCVAFAVPVLPSQAEAARVALASRQAGARKEAYRDARRRAGIVGEVNDQLRAAEQPGSGPVRTLVMHDQKDPGQVYTLVVFERRDSARERDPRRQERLQAVRAMMPGISNGPPEFTDLTVAEKWTG
jgi:hypothetical protein